MKTISPTLRKLVHILNDQQLHSGHNLSQALHISRNAVWKHINQLTKYGIEIETLRSVGYRMHTPLILLDEDEMRARLDAPDIKLSLLGSTASTNDYFRGTAPTRALEFCLAEHQTHGRGRLGRTWIAPFGANILFSCRFSLHRDLSHLGGLSLCVGIATLKALQKFGIQDLACKWPNDILYQNKKLAGVLIETRGEAHGLTEAIIGIGINVNVSERQLKEIDRPTSSLQTILGASQDRNPLAALLINSLSEHLKLFQNGAFDLKKEWAKYDALKDQSIYLHAGQEIIKGIACGIDISGHLLIKDALGKIHAYSAGEASLSK